MEDKPAPLKSSTLNDRSLLLLTQPIVIMPELAILPKMSESSLISVLVQS
uniref:Uncharacterized protein n=1 Tax=Amphimedon queenslandica TaxID=400682 RepID=A0A1X7SLW0_AMPQE